jgi:type 1 fimbria pilin
VKKRILFSAAAGIIMLAATLAGAQSMSGKTVTISGKISDDAKTLVSDDNVKWAVSNPESLTTRTGQQVTVKCRLGLEKNRIQVLSVKPAANEPRYAVNLGDAAFRR